MLGDPNRKISMMVATDSIHGSIFAAVARREGGQGDCVMQSFPNYIDRLGLVRAELKCDQEPSTLDVANTLIKTVSIHEFDGDCNSKRLEREFGAWRRSKFDDSGTARVVNNFQVKGTGRTNALSFYPEDGVKLNMRWMRGVFVGKLDRTDEFLLLTPTGAMKTRCMRRLEGDNAWDLQFLNLCVGSPWNATARRLNKKNGLNT